MKTNSKFWLVVVVCCVSLMVCCATRREYSGELTEKAKVVDLVYTPSRHGTGLGPTFDLTGEGGIGVAITSVVVPEIYAVVFECQHGKFIIQSDQKKAKELWNRLKEGQEVTVRYREVYDTSYYNKEVVEKKLVKYDFIDAN